ncbi:hypothetical protein COL5a_006801 [Colletotrichum fioriniae]|uniref:uncharacterized protein n=1 Tax=Colletotrichum fioriniae TaxID=710243 RepID=UPI002300D440|nr:uncharacterized protein COL516b_008459 [Colletotrichum fioriniae]KAJ0300527.1 hypothetical protein COL516b_008459 [Colletotrichum fioriniae]KAJ0326614.1 hypothetical protein COL5a_006801 [Colletotrichum fioriniae]KAJ3949874.1 hypothetical protein N0V96_001007 [Colletotrichum fioriniae]
MGSIPAYSSAPGESESEILFAVRPPKTDVEWNKIGFTPFQVNGHIECTFTTKSGAWSQPRWVQEPYLKVHGLSPALNYGQQAFEGLRVFRSESGSVQLFRLASHAARFARSAAAVDIPAIPADLFAKSVRLAVLLNSDFVPPFEGGCSMYVRPVVFASSPTMNMYTAEEYTFAVLVTPVGLLYGATGLKALVVEGFDRTAPKGTGAFKVGGNYGPTIPIMGRARKQGYGLTLHLDAETQSFIHEFSASGFIGIKAESTETGAPPTMVIPKDEHILPSITVNSVGQIAQELGWKVEKRPIPFTELGEFSEVYTVGTASSLVPVSAIERESTGERFAFTVDAQSPQSAHARLTDRLQGIKRGLYTEPWGWVEELNGDALRNDIERITNTGSAKSPE